MNSRVVSLMLSNDGSPLYETSMSDAVMSLVAYSLQTNSVVDVPEEPYPIFLVVKIYRTVV